MEETGKTFLPNRNRIWFEFGFFLFATAFDVYLLIDKGGFHLFSDAPSFALSLYSCVFLSAFSLHYASLLTLRYCIGTEFRILIFGRLKRAVPLWSISYIGKPTKFWFPAGNYAAEQKRKEAVEIGYVADGERRLIVGPRERDKFITTLAAAAKAAGATPVVNGMTMRGSNSRDGPNL